MKKNEKKHKSLIKIFRSKGYSTLYNTTKVAQCVKSSNSMNIKDISKFKDFKDSCMLVENTRNSCLLLFKSKFVNGTTTILSLYIYENGG